MKTNSLSFILLVFLILSCKNTTSSNTIESTPEIESLAELSELKLNNGSKWIVNPETHIGVKRMDSLLKSFKGSSKKEFETLGNSLSEQTSFIIKKCSMKGEAHDQLHVVLVPMLETISELKDASSESNKKQQVSHLESLTRTYFKYFELK